MGQFQTGVSPHRKLLLKMSVYGTHGFPIEFQRKLHQRRLKGYYQIKP